MLEKKTFRLSPRLEVTLRDLDGHKTRLADSMSSSKMTVLGNRAMFAVVEINGTPLPQIKDVSDLDTFAGHLTGSEYTRL